MSDFWGLNANHFVPSIVPFIRTLKVFKMKALIGEEKKLEVCVKGSCRTFCEKAGKPTSVQNVIQLCRFNTEMTFALPCERTGHHNVQHSRELWPWVQGGSLIMRSASYVLFVCIIFFTIF